MAVYSPARRQLLLALKPRKRLKVKSVVNVDGQRPVVSGLPPAVIVHGLKDARLALSSGQPVTLLSAPGAGLYAGCGWWRALVAAARAAHPDVAVADVLDCGEATGQALAALRIGLCRLVLASEAPGRDAVVAIAAEHGGFVLAQAPPALDLAARGAQRRLHEWLQSRAAPGDSEPCPG